jgi:hypothetical protein
MIDLVYVYRSSNEDLELRYSLRSVDQYVPHRNVIIVGDRPDFLNNVIHIDFPDGFANVHGGKYKNVLRKIKAACEDDRVSDQFVLMNDDFFFLKDTDTIKPATNGTLADLIEYYDGNTRNQYLNALKRTQRYLRDAGIDNPLNYAVHYPIVFDKEKCLEMIENIDWLERPMSWRTLYGNLFEIGSTPTEDPKVHSPATLKEWLNSGHAAEFLSISDSVALDPTFRNWIEKRFTKKSKYEN